MGLACAVFLITLFGWIQMPAHPPLSLIITGWCVEQCQNHSPAVHYSRRKPTDSYQTMSSNLQSNFRTINHSNIYNNTQTADNRDKPHTHPFTLQHYAVINEWVTLTVSQFNMYMGSTLLCPWIMAVVMKGLQHTKPAFTKFIIQFPPADQPTLFPTSISKCSINSWWMKVSYVIKFKCWQTQ